MGASTSLDTRASWTPSWTPRRTPVARTGDRHFHTAGAALRLFGTLAAEAAAGPAGPHGTGRGTPPRGG